MRVKNICVIALITLLCIPNSNAQTEQQKNAMRAQAAIKVDVLNGFIKDIARKEEPMEYRMYYREQALKLFINNGDSYKIRIKNSNGVEEVTTREGVMMEVTSVNRNTSKRYLFKTYLYNLAHLKYDEVYIESTDVASIKVSDMYKIGENLYTCTCFFKQAFVGYRDGRPVYRDITEKKVECWIRMEWVAGEAKPDYVIMLGDVTALSTQRMSNTPSNSNDKKSTGGIQTILNNL